MSEIDRRKSDERRSSKRYAVQLDVEWQGHSGRRQGTMSDISHEGCFILSDVDLSDGEFVKVFIPLSGGMQVEFLGQVANFVNEIGFAVHFISMTESQKEFLENFVEIHAGGPTV
ncbi:MAG TPA: PilZ domain-containing protein [Pyrinomonadaceae bacterium]|nr:PilZ domain-containing protein [Pyrinomonadaceae bacterium]